MQTSNLRQPLSIFSLAMMNVIAVDSLRNLTVSAMYGTALVFFYLLAGILFYIPTILVGAELATGWPQTGGAYIWVREAFGKRLGFLAIWLQWGYNVVWYPTILSFIAGTMAYLINPALATNKYYMLFTVLAIYWGITFINCQGIRVSSRISVIGAIVGTLTPMVFIIILGAIWLIKGQPSYISFAPRHFFPEIHHLGNLAFLIGLIFSLMGMELSAIHAGDVKNPQKNYPRALLISGIIIWFSLVLSSLTIAMVIPKEKLNFVSGLIDAFHMIFSVFHMEWVLPIMALSIVIGCMSEVSTWVLGPGRGLLIAARESEVLRRLHGLNKKNAPSGILIFQAIIFTILCSVFLLMPSVNSSYWILTALTSQIALLYYAFLFAAALKLRYKAPMVPRAFQIPGGLVGMWIVVIFGISSCFLAILLGFQPPSSLKLGSVFYYEAFLVSGLLVFCGLPWLLFRRADIRQSR